MNLNTTKNTCNAAKDTNNKAILDTNDNVENTTKSAKEITAEGNRSDEPQSREAPQESKERGDLSTGMDLDMSVEEIDAVHADENMTAKEAEVSDKAGFVNKKCSSIDQALG